MSYTVAYIMSRFPLLSETFILREMIALEKEGWTVELYPLILEKQSVVHEEAISWLRRAHTSRWISENVIVANLRKMVERPRLYFSLLDQVILENCSSLRFLLRALLIFPKSVYLAELMERDAVAHIHAHFATHSALVAWIIHGLTGISYSITVHAHDIFVDRSMLRMKIRSAAFVVCISEYNREFLVRQIGDWIKLKTHIIHCGVDPNRYKPSSRTTPNLVFEILSIGSLQPYKGMGYLIESCLILKEHGFSFRCRIVGEGEMRPVLHRMIHQLGLEQDVFLLGAKTQTEVAALLGGSHCYVQPSIIMDNGKMEGIPVALMEALACGLPVVASELSGIPELVHDGETGYLVPPANSATLATTLEHIYQHPKEAFHYGEAGRLLILKEYDIQKNVRHISALFTKVIEEIN